MYSNVGSATIGVTIECPTIWGYSKSSSNKTGCDLFGQGKEKCTSLAFFTFCQNLTAMLFDKLFAKYQT